MRKPRPIFVVLCLIFLPLFGCEKKCEVPAGTYEMTFSAIEGNCEENIWKPFDGHTDTLEVEEGRACKRFLTSEAQKLSANCDMNIEFSAIQDGRGLSDGQAVIRVKCEEGYTCRHLYKVDYKRLEGP